MTVPEDGTDAFYEGFELEDNPFPEWEQRFEEWDRNFLDAANSHADLMKTDGTPVKRRNTNGDY